jgi:uncharacterized membrane protein YdjX (TVP38/TMEM64 family)
MNKPVFFRLAALVVLGGTIVACFWFLPIQRYVDWFLESVRVLGAWGPVLLGAAYIPACLFLVPGLVLSLGAGVAFGVLWGTVAVSIGSTLGAAAAFLTGRTLARRWIEERVTGNPRFRAIDQAVGAQGFKIVLLLRLSPVFPFNLLNYALGLTKVSFRDYVLASWIGMLPGTVMYVYLGSAIGDLAALRSGKVEGGVEQKALFFLGLLATVAVTVLVTRIARQALQEAVPLTANAPRVSTEGVPDA